MKVYNALLKRYPSSGRSPQWAVVQEVRDAGGFAASRALDVLAISLWPSGGHDIHGIEIKMSRSDWLRELKDASKSNAFFEHCNAFWLCAGDDSVVKDVDEVPKQWGLMVLRKGKLYTVKKAPVLTPKPLTHELLATILKRAASEIPALRAATARAEANLESWKAANKADSRNDDRHRIIELQHRLRSADRLRARLTAVGFTDGDIDIDALWAGMKELRDLAHAQDRLHAIEHQLVEVKQASDRAVEALRRDIGYAIHYLKSVALPPKPPPEPTSPPETDQT